MAVTIQNAFDHLKKSNYEDFYKDFSTAIIDLGKDEKATELLPELDNRALVAVEVFENVLNSEIGIQIISDQNKIYLEQGMKKFKASQKKQAEEKEQKEKEVKEQDNNDKKREDQEQEALLKKNNEKTYNDKVYEYQVAEMDAAAFKALQRYKKEKFFSKKEKYLAWAGYFITGTIAFSFGMIECGTTVAQIASNISIIALSPALWPILIPIALGLIFGGISTYAAWHACKGWVNGLFQELGSNSLTKGLSTVEKRQLAVFAVTLAIPTAVVIAALGVAPAASSLPMVLGIAGLAAASAFPPFAIAIAIVVGVGMTYMLCMVFREKVLKRSDPEKNNHADLSLTYKFKEFVRAPFTAMKENIDKNENLTGWKKTAALCGSGVITALFCLTGVAGLAAAAFCGGGSTANLAMKWFNANLKVANWIGIALGEVISFLARLPFTIASMGDVCQFFGEKATGGNANKEFSFKEAGLAAIDSSCQAAFYGLLGMGNVPTQVNSAGAVTAGARAFCGTARGMFVDKTIEAKSIEAKLIEAQANSNIRRKQVVELPSVADKIEKDQDESNGVKFTDFRQEYLKHCHWYNPSRIKDDLLAGKITTIAEVCAKTNNGTDGRTGEILARLGKKPSK